MEQSTRTKLITVGVISLALIICGAIGYTNRLVQVKTTPTVAEPTGSSTTLTENLDDCPQPGRLCLDSFGTDNSQNILLTLTNNSTSIQAIYIKLEQDGETTTYPCQKVQPAPETFYCLGGPVSADATIKIAVFAKSTDRLLASAELSLASGLERSIATPTEPPLLQIITDSPASATPTPTVAYPYP